MLKFVLTICLVAACQAQESTTVSSFQNFFNNVKNVDFAKLSAGAAKAQETFGPMLSQFKAGVQPLQNKLSEAGLVPTTTANPVGGVLKHLQMVGIGSDIDVAKVQENAKKAQDTFAPLFSQFSSFVNKKSSSGAQQPQPVAGQSPIDQYIIEDKAAAPAAPVAPPAAPVASPVAPAAPAGSSPSNIQNAVKTLQDVGSKIDINQVKEGAQKLQSFFSQFGKKSGTS